MKQKNEPQITDLIIITFCFTNKMILLKGERVGLQIGLDVV